ncbi:hypothetical protein BsWGS_02024 [Bradybaena similaris]
MSCKSLIYQNKDDNNLPTLQIVARHHNCLLLLFSSGNHQFSCYKNECDNVKSMTKCHISAKPRATVHEQDFFFFFASSFTLLSVEGDTSSFSMLLWRHPVLSFYVLVMFV